MLVVLSFLHGNSLEAHVKADGETNTSHWSIEWAQDFHPLLDAPLTSS